MGKCGLVPSVSVGCLQIAVSTSVVLSVSSGGSSVKGKERSRIRRMRGISRRKEERRKDRKQEKARKRVTKYYDKKELRRRIANS